MYVVVVCVASVTLRSIVWPPFVMMALIQLHFSALYIHKVAHMIKRTNHFQINLLSSVYAKPGTLI